MSDLGERSSLTSVTGDGMSRLISSRDLLVSRLMWMSEGRDEWNELLEVLVLCCAGLSSECVATVMAGMVKVIGGNLSCGMVVGEVNLSTAAIASSKYAVLTDVCFVVAAEGRFEIEVGAGGGIDVVGCSASAWSD
jgi:hypothetical protein